MAATGVPPTTPSELPPGPATPPPLPASTLGKRPAHSPWVTIGAIVVVAIVILAIFAWTWPGSGNGGGGPPVIGQTPVFSAASSAAQYSSRGESGGPWYPVAAVGIALSNPVDLPVANLTNSSLLSGCTLRWISSEPSFILLPATPGSSGPGEAGAWLFALSNFTLSNVPALLFTLVADRNATPLFLASGTCTIYLYELASIASGIVDSTAAVAAANSTNGSEGTRFLSAHPGAARTFLAYAPSVFGLLTEYRWEVAYTTCGFGPGSPSTGTTFNVTLDGSNAQPIGSPGLHDGNCTGAIPLP